MNRLCWSFVPAAFFAATLMQAQDAPVVKAKSQYSDNVVTKHNVGLVCDRRLGA